MPNDSIHRNSSVASSDHLGANDEKIDAGKLTIPKKDGVSPSASSDDALGAKVRDYEEAKDVDEKSKAKFKQLTWLALTVCLIVEAIALGALSLPSVFASVGLIAGVLMTVGIGLIAIYTSLLVGEACHRSPTEVEHYHDLGGQMFGTWGKELTGGIFVLYLALVTGSHSLTGAIAFETITNNATCSVVFTVVSAILLFLLALPPSFAEVAILGYIDFVSIIVAILVTMVATGIKSAQAPGGLAAVDWSPVPQESPTFAKAMVGVANIVFAFSFAITQPSFQNELKRPGDYKKACWALGLIEILIYTLTGAIIYVFVGSEVQSPALLSAGPLLSKIVFGIALPVIFISGSINTTTAARYVHVRIFGNTRHRWISTKTGILAWVGINAAIVIFGEPLVFPGASTELTKDFSPLDSSRV